MLIFALDLKSSLFNPFSFNYLKVLHTYCFDDKYNLSVTTLTVFEEWLKVVVQTKPFEQPFTWQLSRDGRPGSTVFSGSSTSNCHVVTR